MKRNLEEEVTRKGTLEEEVAPMMRGVGCCGRIFVNAGGDSIEEGQEGLEDEVDFSDEFVAIVEEWQSYGGFLEAYEGAAFKEKIMFVEMGHEEAQKMNFFSLRMERVHMESEVQVGMMVSEEKMQHGQAMFTLIRDCKPRCKMKIYKAAWFQEHLYLPKVKMKALLFFLTCVSLQVSKRIWKALKVVRMVQST